MSPEVCPFCGKSFKRLKSHLPHCKAAKTSKTTSHQHEETKISSYSASSKPSLPPLGPNQSQHSAKTETSTQTTLLDTKGNEKLVKTQTKPNVAKKMKLKLSEKIKMATESSSQVYAVTPVASKSKKKIPMPSQTEKESIGIYLENEDLFSSSKAKNYKEENKKIGMDVEKLKFNQTLKSKSPKLKTLNISQTDSKKELNHILTKKTVSIKEKLPINSRKTSRKDNFWSEEEKIDRQLPEDDIWTSRQDTRITLNDVRTTLGRVKQNGHQIKGYNLDDKLSTDELKCEIMKPKVIQSALVRLQQEPPSQLITFPHKSLIALSESPNFMSYLSKIENKDCNFMERADILKDGLQMDSHTMGLAALSSPARTFLEAEVSTKAFQRDAAPLLKENIQKAEGRMQARESDPATRRDGCDTRGALSQQRLGQVTLRELPDWLVSRSPRRPRDAMQMVQRGWEWYYRRYIDVKRGGVGGVAMLLVGYCVLSYVWAFPHLKLERWRKYH